MNIINYEILTDIYGKWPCFHDAEVLSIKLTRSLGLEKVCDVKVVVNCFTMETVNEGTAEFETVKTNNYTIEFLFSDVTNLVIDGFNHQNVIDDIEFTDEVRGIKVEFVPIFGVSSVFTCKRVEVLSANPIPRELA